MVISKLTFIHHGQGQIDLRIIFREGKHVVEHLDVIAHMGWVFEPELYIGARLNSFVKNFKSWHLKIYRAE